MSFHFEKAPCLHDDGLDRMAVDASIDNQDMLRVLHKLLR